MGDRRSKEDYVHQISTSIYVTNFSEQFSFRDLWKKCQEYGRAIDVYIPNRRTKSGDRFGFVRFIHIKDVDRLVKNLCTLWMGRLRLHANVARFQRPPLNKVQHVKGANVGQKSFGVSSNSKVFSVSQSSYAGAVKNNGNTNRNYWRSSNLMLELDRGFLLWKDEEEDESDEDLLDNEFDGKKMKKFCKPKGEIQSEDPFHIYDLLVKKPKSDNKEEDSSKATLKYHPGFTLDDVLRTKDVQDVDDVVEVQENTQKSNKLDNFTKDNNSRGVTHSKKEDKESFCSGHFRRSVGPQTGIMGFCPNITSITLDRYLSDHRPIILRDVCHDYGPIPFRMYHYWFDWNGFGRFIIDTWSNMSISDTNAILKFMKKLRHLKLQTRLWVGDKKESATTKKAQLKGMLKDIDILIDEKKVDQELLNKRMNVINSIHDLEKLEATEIAQKANIKWSIKEDENSKFFHGILNKKGNQHAICGILSEGNWIEDPNSVKNDFFSHFKERFDSPCSSRLMLKGEFPNKLSADQSIDLESNVTIEEIKRAVQILDGPFILDELIHWCHAKKKETMIFKVDFEKAYDSVRWDYLDDVLNKFRFGSKWRNWIHNCLNSSKGSILVNGSPIGEFNFGKALNK
nr:RNA-directed DNA polymerase, eukaryota [Tanacetum cinerariifolium]